MRGRLLTGIAHVTLVAVASYWLVGVPRLQASTLGETIRDMPGVVDVDLGYLGDPRTVLMDVVLARDVTPLQAADVGRTFVDGVTDTRLRGDSRLHLRYPAAGAGDLYVPDFSQAAFQYSGTAGPGRHDVTDSIVLWLRAARAPGVAHASLTAPWGSSPRTRRMTLILGVDEAALDPALVEDVAQRTESVWRYFALTGPLLRPHEYRGSPAPPDEQEKAAFGLIAAAAGDDNDLVVRRWRNVGGISTSTSVEVGIAEGPDRRDRTLRTAEAVADLAPLLAPEVDLVVLGEPSATVVVGGCPPPDDAGRSELEMYLAEKYETC